jgi:SAM-dependent methyltransferase
MPILTEDQDAFGAALVAHMDGTSGDRVLLLEVDDGRVMPAMHPSGFFTTPDAWLPWERELLADVEGPVLDLGCGAGRHALHLQERGLEVTGVDVSPGAVDTCHRRGLRDVRLSDLRTPPDDQPWRTVLLMCGNLGLAGGWDETRALLSDLRDVCAPGALVVGDTVDPTLNTDPQSVAYREAKVASGRHLGEVGLRLRFGDVVTPFWNLLNVPPGDLQALVDGTGWELRVHVAGDWDHAVVLSRV